MAEENKPSEKHILFIYFCYISVLLLIITSILNLWTALASLGAFFLFLICPFITGIIAFKNYKKIKISKAYKNLFYFSSFYTIGVIIIIIFAQIF